MSDFYSKFLEDADPDYDFLIEDHASCGLAFPSFASTSDPDGANFFTVDEWISSKDFYNSRNLNQIRRRTKNPQMAERLDDYEICNTQRLLPICIEDLIYRCKTPKWTRNSLILKHLGDRLIGSFCRDFRDHKTTKLTRKEALDFMSGALYSTVHTPDYVEAAAFDQISHGAGNENPYLDDCLTILENWPNKDSYLVVYPDGRDHESLRLTNLRINFDETDKFIQVAAEKSSPTIHLGAEILQVEFLAHHDLSLTNNRRVVCRTDKNLQLITIGENLDVKCEMWNENMKLATLCQNPYLNGELAFLDASSQIFISSLDTTFSLTSATKLSLSQDSNDQKNFFHRLCWSDHPRQIFALKNNYLNLIDLRDRNCGQFWVQNASKIHTIERFDDDSKYYLLTNDRSAFIIDQRQTGRSVFDFHHNFIDQPTFTAVSDSLQKNSQLDLHRLLILCSRQLNDVFWTPLIWCRKSMTICQGLAPQFVPSLSDNVEWFKCSRPLTTCTTSFQKRCQAPVRGLKLMCDIALILNDVGDLGYMTFQLGEGNALTLSNSPMYKKELDTIGDFIRSRSSIYIKNNVPEKPAEFLNAENNCDRSTLLDSMTNLSVADDLQISSNFDSSALSQQDLFEKHDVESVIASNIKSDDDDAETAFEEHIFLCDLKSQISSDLNNLIGKNVDDNGRIVLELWNSNDE